MCCVWSYAYLLSVHVHCTQHQNTEHVDVLCVSAQSCLCRATSIGLPTDSGAMPKSCNFFDKASMLALKSCFACSVGNTSEKTSYMSLAMLPSVSHPMIFFNTVVTRMVARFLKSVVSVVSAMAALDTRTERRNTTTKVNEWCGALDTRTPKHNNNGQSTKALGPNVLQSYRQHFMCSLSRDRCVCNLPDQHHACAMCQTDRRHM